MKEGDIITTDHVAMKRMISKCIGQLFVSKFGNSDEMSKFIKRQPSKSDLKEMHNVSCPEGIKEASFVI